MNNVLRTAFIGKSGWRAGWRFLLFVAIAFAVSQMIVFGLSAAGHEGSRRTLGAL